MSGSRSAPQDGLEARTGAATVLGDNPALYPVGLAFAAGAMGFVVFHEMLPELKSRGGLPQVSGALAGGIALMLGVDLFLG